MRRGGEPGGEREANTVAEAETEEDKEVEGLALADAPSELVGRELAEGVVVVGGADCGKRELLMATLGLGAACPALFWSQF